MSIIVGIWHRVIPWWHWKVFELILLRFSQEQLLIFTIY